MPVIINLLDQSVTIIFFLFKTFLNNFLNYLAAYAVSQPNHHNTPIMQTPSPPSAIHNQQYLHHHHHLMQQQQQNSNRIPSSTKQPNLSSTMSMPRLQKIAPYPNVHINEKLVVSFFFYLFLVVFSTI